MINLKEIYKSDPDVAKAIEKEFDRQQGHIELIASENFVSLPVMAAMGTHLPTNMQKVTQDEGTMEAANMWI